MPTENGYSNQKKKGQSQFKTINQVGSNQFGNPISQKTLFDKTPSAIAITAVADILGVDGQVEFWQITLPLHTASKNDVMRMITGTLLAWEYDILQVIDANNFYILPISDTKPIVTETAKVLGWTTSKSSQEGELVAVLAPSPIAYVLDGVDTEVEEDTAVAANNKALPSQLFIYKDGTQYPISIDTGTPANTVGVPVILTGAAGPINITAGDLNVQLTDQGANYDATRIGDGTNLLGINANNEALVKDTDAAGFLSNIDGYTANLQQTVSSDGGVIPPFAQLIGGKNGTDFLGLSMGPAGEANVIITSAVLPTGAATETKQDTGNTSLSSIDTKLSSQATAANQTSTNTKLDTVITNTTAIATAANQASELVLIGAVIETAPATDTASSGLNGRLQRIAQRLTSLIALFPTSLGTKTAANSLAVTLSSDQAAIPNAVIAGTITNAQVTVGLTAVRATVAGSAPNAARKRLSIKPSKNNTGAIYYGSSSVTTSNGLEIIGPDRLDFTFDASDYYLRSDTATQVVEIVEVI
jgi:hypothetical protein